MCFFLISEREHGTSHILSGWSGRSREDSCQAGCWHQLTISGEASVLTCVRQRQSGVSLRPFTGHLLFFNSSLLFFSCRMDSLLCTWPPRRTTWMWCDTFLKMVETRAPPQRWGNEVVKQRLCCGFKETRNCVTCKKDTVKRWSCSRIAAVLPEKHLTVIYVDTVLRESYGNTGH